MLKAVNRAQNRTLAHACASTQITLARARARLRIYTTRTQPLDEDKLPNSIRNAANVAAFAAGDSMTAVYKKAAGMQVLSQSTHPAPAFFALEQ
jgi:hypothetical protein